MADQASVNGRAAAGVPGSSSVGFDGVAEFVDDLASLAELQAKLLGVDLRDAVRKSAIPLVLTGGGLAVIVASVPVALLGAGWLLATALKIHQGWAMLITAGAAIALGGLVAGLAGMRLRHSCDSFRRSRKQLWLNLAWARTVLVTSAAHACARSGVCDDSRLRGAEFPYGSLNLNCDLPGEPESLRYFPQQRSPTTMEINVQTIQGEWNHLCALARQRWTQLTEDDLRIQEQNIEQLIGRIQQKTGEGREAIEAFFSEMTLRGSSAVAHAAEAAGQYAHQVSDQIRERYDSAEGLVRRHPTETVVAAFGIGLVAGLIAGLAIRGR